MPRMQTHRHQVLLSLVLTFRISYCFADKSTGMGRGFGFVTFENKEGMYPCSAVQAFGCVGSFLDIIESYVFIF
jgi:hypothetical protein